MDGIAIIFREMQPRADGGGVPAAPGSGPGLERGSGAEGSHSGMVHRMGTCYAFWDGASNGYVCAA